MLKVNFSKYINKTVILGILNNSWTLISGPITMYLILKYFTPTQQGFYYTFSSLIALQIFAELGLSTVIISFASHEWSKLSLDKTKAIIGDSIAISRLSSLYKLAFKWFIYGGICIIFLLLFSGIYFFKGSSNQQLVNWTSPWYFLCFFTGLNLWFIPFYSILEGCNQIDNIYGFKLRITIITSIISWITIPLGASLWVLVINSFVTFLLNFYFLYSKYFIFFKTLISYKLSEKISFIQLWPMQWRIALSWISGYFLSSFFTPLVFRIEGSIAAGQIGLTLIILNALSSLSVTWIVIQRPNWGILIAQNKITLLKKSHIEVTIVSIVVFTLGILFLGALIYFANYFHHPWSNRFLSPTLFCLFSLGMLANVSTTSFAYYLRAYNEEPYLGQSVISAILHFILAIFFGYKFGLLGIAGSYFIISLFFSLPYALIVWKLFIIKKNKLN